MHMAIGTSFGAIMFTSVSSAMAHHRHGGVDWHVFRCVALGILVGTYCGSFVAARHSGALPADVLRGVPLLRGHQHAAQQKAQRQPQPARFAGMTGAGAIIGAVSSLVGIGGGTLSVPFLVWHNMDMRRAVGTSAAMGFPIAFAGCLGFVTNGWNNPELPPYAFGYLYLPALVGIVAISMLTAPVGASIAHKLPVPQAQEVLCLLPVRGGHQDAHRRSVIFQTA